MISDSWGWTSHDFSYYFRRCWWECLFLFLKFFMFQIDFTKCWRNFLGCSQGVGIFSRVFGEVFLIIGVVEHALIFKAHFFEGVNTVLVIGCHWEGQSDCQQMWFILSGTPSRLIQGSNNENIFLEGRSI